MKTLFSPIEFVPWRRDYIPAKDFHDAHVYELYHWLSSLDEDDIEQLNQIDDIVF